VLGRYYSNKSTIKVPHLCAMKVVNLPNLFKLRVLACIGLLVLAVSIFTLRSPPVVYAGPEAGPEKPG